MARRILMVLAVALVSVTTGCDSQDASSEKAGRAETTPTRTTPATTGPTTTIGTSEPVVFPKSGSSPPRISGDGRYFGYIRSASASERAIDFDVAQFFYGASVQKAAEKDGVVQPGESVPNDHYERNPEPDVDQLKLAQDVSLNAASPAGFLMRYVARAARLKCERGASPVPCTQLPLTPKAFFAATRDLPAGQGIPVWITLRTGLVERVDEQYFP
jgi:hypothetical protein